jgi:hypothetical protein
MLASALLLPMADGIRAQSAEQMVPLPSRDDLPDPLLALRRGEVPLTDFTLQPEKLLGMAGSKR